MLLVLIDVWSIGSIDRGLRQFIPTRDFSLGDTAGTVACARSNEYNPPPAPTPGLSNRVYECGRQYRGLERELRASRSEITLSIALLLPLRKASVYPYRPYLSPASSPRSDVCRTDSPPSIIGLSENECDEPIVVTEDQGFVSRRVVVFPVTSMIASLSMSVFTTSTRLSAIIWRHSYRPRIPAVCRPRETS